MQRDLVIHAAEGALGGIASTLFMSSAMKLGARLPPTLQPTAPTQHPGEFVVSQLERVVRRPLPPSIHRAAVASMPWAYGVLWPTAFALIARRLRIRRLRDALLAGAGLGAGVWAVGYLGWLPAVGLVQPIHRQPPLRSASSLLSHAAYGVLATLPLFLLGRRPRRRRGLLAALRR